jgi:hypothetical protein
MWKSCAQYLDGNLAQRAPTNGLVSSFWELYLAHALETHGVRLVSRSRRVPRREGPDLFAESPDVWVEAVAATPGTGLDALASRDGNLPIDQFVLRLREAIDKKSVQLAEHARRNYIRTGQATVIAISGALLPYRCNEQPVPYVVRAVLGVGNLVLEYERATLKPIGKSLEFRDEVKKVSTSSVNTGIFLNDEYSHVSAVLYSRSCWVYHPQIAGAEFIVIHNRRAQAPLPDGWFPLGNEYWLDGTGLRHTRHAINDER